MTPEELKAIQDRVILVGTGEWFYNFAPGCIQPHSVMYKTRNGMSAICSTTYANESSRNDAEFIAHARQDVPALLNEVEKLNLQLREITAYVDKLIGDARDMEKQVADANLKVSELQKTIENALNVLGPVAPKSKGCTCEGCVAEIAEAIEILGKTKNPKSEALCVPCGRIFAGDACPICGLKQKCSNSRATNFDHRWSEAKDGLRYCYDCYQTEKV